MAPCSKRCSCFTPPYLPSLIPLKFALSFPAMFFFIIIKFVEIFAQRLQLFQVGCIFFNVIRNFPDVFVRI